MASVMKWESAWVQRGNTDGYALQEELNSLAASARTNAGVIIDNSVNLDQYGKVEVDVDFVSAPAAGGYVQIHMLTAPDGTNWEDGSSTVDPGAHTIVAVIPVRASDTAQKLCSGLFPLQPAKTALILYNGTNQAFPASGSVVKFFTSNDEAQ